MARVPKQTRAKVTVDAIIEASFLAIAKYGLENATTRKIADIAGCSIGSLYEYFENKEAVFNAMSLYFINDIVDLIYRTKPKVMHEPVDQLVHILLVDFTDLLQQNNKRYLNIIKYIGSFDYSKYSPPVEKAIMDLVMHYLFHNTDLAKIPNISTVIYICMNASIFTLTRHLTSQNTFILTEDLMLGIERMINSYVEKEIALAM